MSFSDPTIIAEGIAALAVILSIAFLAYELHLTRKQSEYANWREVLQSLSDYKAATNDLTFAEFFERGHQDYAALSPAERRSFGLYLEQGVHIYGNFLKHNDALPRKLEGLEDAIMNHFGEMLTSPGGAVWWQEAHGRGRFMPDTYRTVDRLLAARARKGG